MKRTIGLLAVALWLGLNGCQKSKQEVEAVTNQAEYLRQAEDKLTEIIIHDIFSPPVASRIYAYSHLAAYEALLPAYPTYQSMAGQLRDFKPSPQPEAGTETEISYPLASLRAYLTVGRQWTFSTDVLDAYEGELYGKFEETLPGEVYERSMAYGEAVGKHVIAYSMTDNYKQTRGFKHTVTSATGSWVPTPPAYLDAVEPRWRTIRSFTLDSAAQFSPPAPPAFDLTKTSPFYKELVHVYETGKNLNEEQREIANFWDCNPFKMNVQGHAMFATKKLSPGGHWMSIVGLVTREKKADFMQTAEAYLLTSVALFDGFISCWDEKYRSNRVRPESVINAHLDKDWLPLLQTPPFPEYTSGHSVISAASSLALTSLFGDNCAFADSSEVAYGLPVRKFPSFKAAAQEAAISRLYGGIHYQSAIENGFEEGTRVGEWVLSKVKTRKTAIAMSREQ
jgi:hypothetical protein